MNADDSVSIECRNALFGARSRSAMRLVLGFWKRFMKNALLHELRKAGLMVGQQHGIVVFYDATVVGQYAVDLLVETAIMVELKAVEALDNTHNAQCINYLRATGLPLCLLLNFGKPRVEIRRFLSKS